MLSTVENRSRNRSLKSENFEKYGPDLKIKVSDEVTLNAQPVKELSAESTGKNDKSSSNSKSMKHRILKIKLKKITNWSGCNSIQLDDEPFYHGYMGRDEAERLLKSHGDFLLRKTELTKRGEVVVISIFWNDEHHHLVIEKSNGSFFLKDFCFQSISDLVRYHLQNRAEIYHTGIKLFSWVAREEWQLYHEQIVLGKKLGNGEFGEVFQGTLTLGVFKKDVEVAIKTMKNSKVTADEKITFLREANLMLKLDHKYVVKLFGVATQKEPIMIVMELCDGGSLRGRLNDKKTVVSQEMKRKFCLQIAKGMRYLEKKQVIHRDLAARNCLLDKSDNCKISDFGLSLLGICHKEKRLMKVPVRWLAPETLSKGVYSTKSDVWSFGVVMFEVYSNGKIPYEHIKVLREVRQQVMENNLRLEPPPEMPDVEAEIMKLCFEPFDKRPTFIEICENYRQSTSHFPSFNVLLSKFKIGENN